MKPTSHISPDQARGILRKQVLARTTLTGFARYVDIPGVPDDDASDRATTVVETPLARHHIVGLQAMQLLVQNALFYDAQVLDSPVDFGLLRTDWAAGETADPALKTPHRGRNRWGGGSQPVLAPSANSPKIGQFPDSDLDAQVPDFPQISKIPPEQSAEKHGDISEKTAVLPDSTLEKPASLLPQGFEAANPSPSKPENSFPNPDPPADRFSAQRAILGQILSGAISDLEGRQQIVNLGRLAECRRIMLLEPPGSAKSTYGSVICPAWVLGKQKMFEMILTGWGDPICRRHGKRARQVCSSPAFTALFNTTLDPKTTAAEDWALLNQSSYKSSGITSGVSGFRCHGLVWDDLTKNRKEADSPTIRLDTYNEYIDSARSRKTPDAWEIGIGTRWHQDEIMGMILPEGYAGESGFMRCRDGNVWFVICMAAECERADDPLGREIGEMIWPEWFGEGYWDDKRKNPRSWGSLYQQRPAPESGIVFMREDDRRHDGHIEGDYYISFDPAVSEAEDADDTAMHVWCVDSKGAICEVDEWVRQATMDVWIDQLLVFVRKYKPLECISESGVIRRAAEPFLKRAMIKKGVFAKFTWITRHADKVAMARSAQAMHASHQIYLLEGPVGDLMIDELCAFPASKKDHRVDSLVNLCLRLEAIWDSKPSKKTEPKPVKIGAFGGDPIPIKRFMPERFAKRRSRWNRN